MAWLQGWKKRIELAIDNTLIDAELTDFPVAVALGSSVGADSQDLTAVFDELGILKEKFTAPARADSRYPVSDALSGEDGSLPNKRYWDWQSGYDNENARIRSNKFNYSGTETSNQDVRLYSEFRMSGDFDAQVDFDFTTMETGAASQRIRFLINGGIGSGTYAYISFDRLTGGGYQYNAYDGTTNETFSTTDTSGKLRIVRTGTTIKGYVWNSTSEQWEWDSSTAGVTFSLSTSWALDTRLDFYQAANAELDANFSNFRINSCDEVRWKLDRRLWTDYDYTEKIWIPGGEGYAYLKAEGSTDWAATNFALKGDFDIQADYEILTGGATDTWSMRLTVGGNNTGSQPNDLFMVQRDYSSGHRYYCNENDGSSWGAGTSVSTSDTSGKLRIVRETDDFSAYYWDATAEDWVYIDTYTVSGLNGDNCYINLRAYSGTGDPVLEATIDNLQVNSGTVVFDGEIYASSQARKVAFTSSDGETQLYAEIEQFDHDNEAAVYHVKIPTVASDADTTFYLYFDNDQEPNDDYIGIPGESPAVGVWDSNFVAVYHFGEDPANGVLVDSSGHNNDGTPTGSMTSGDLVDGPVGKALDFDGNDAVELTNHADFSPGSVHTVEGFFATTADYAGGGGLIFSDYGADTDNYVAIGILTDNKAFGNYRDGGGDAILSSGNGAAVNDGDFHGLAYVRTSLTTARLDLDGTTLESPSNGSTGTITTSDGTDPRIGCLNYSGNSNFITGQISEVRISDTDRSAAWIKATYNTLMDNLVSATDLWVGGYDKKSAITIDSSLIDSTLTDFPVAVALNEMAGASGQDMADIFDELIFSPDDTFNGADDDSPDSELWTTVAGTPVVKSNKMRMTCDAQDDELESIFSISGDFDIQVDVDLVTYPSTSSWSMQLRLLNYAEDTGVMMDIRDEGSGRMIENWEMASSSWTQRDTDSTALTSTKLRLARSGSNIIGYFWNGSSWTQQYTSSVLGTEDIYIHLRAGNWDTNPTAVADFDNLTITSGEVVWDLGDHPNFDRIQFALQDGTLLYAECEQYDTVNRKAVFHVKVPSISSSEDTVFNLFYGPNGAANSTYVGIPGGAAAQNVWDSDFKAVYHLSEDPSGGSGCMLDSTGGNHDGTPAGSMTAGDLVDGAIGKALDFDGSDDHIDLANHADFSPGSTFSMEAVFKTAASYASAALCFSNYGGGGTDAIYLGVGSDEKAFGRYRDSGLDAIEASANSAVLNDSAWHHLAFVRTALTTARMDIDGVTDQSPTNASTGAIDVSDGTAPTIGCGDSVGTPANFWNGLIAEVRISSVARSAAWLKATYYTLFDNLLTFSSPWVQDYAERLTITIPASAIDSDLEDFPVTIHLDDDCGTASYDAGNLFDSLNAGAAVSGFANKIKLTIDSSLIDADLQDFPVAVQISATCGIDSADATAFFDELGASDSLKVAFADKDGNQFYAECENFDDTSEVATYHVKIPFVSSSEDTIFYLHYDSTASANTSYVGAPGDTVSQNVWDKDFEAVYHLAEDPSGGAGCILDSTGNHDGTPAGSMTAGDLVDADVGKGLDFDGSDDAINLGDWDLSRATIEGMIKCSASDLHMIAGRDNPDDYTPDRRAWQVRLDTDGTPRAIFFSDPTTNGQATGPASGANDGTFHHICATFDSSTIYMYDNGSPGSGTSFTGPIDDITLNGWIAKAETTDESNVTGILSEVRFSSEARSAAWVKATYLTLTDALITVGGDDQLHFSFQGESGVKYYAECEAFDPINQVATWHVKVPAISSDKGTIFYAYFDPVTKEADYTGELASAVGQNVWDDDFLAVWHFAQDPSEGDLVDSKGAVSDLTAQSGMTSGDLIDGPVGKGWDLDGSDDRAYITSDPFSSHSDGQLEAFFNAQSFDSPAKLACVGGADVAIPGILGFEVRDISGTKYASMICRPEGGSTSYVYGDTEIAISTDYLITYKSSGSAWSLAVNDQADESLSVGTGSNTGEWFADHSIGTPAFEIGVAYYDGSLSNYWDGQIYEMRVSQSVRSAAWQKATYKTISDTLASYTDSLAVGTPVNVNLNVISGAWTFNVNSLAQVDIDLDLNSISGAWTFNVNSVSVDINLHSLRLMDRPEVSAAKPKVTAAGKQPYGTASGAGPYGTATGE